MKPSLKGYSLWFMPERDIYLRYQAWITDFSKHWDKAPIFEPHVTLWGMFSGQEAEAVALTKKVALKIKEPALIQIEDFEMTEAYFQCLYLTVKKTPELEKAYEVTNEVFSKQDYPPYKPHLSLLYGEFPEEKKRAFASKLPSQKGISFLADKVFLYWIEDDFKKWKRVFECPIQGNKVDV